jgi:hypothetical protein
MWEKCNHDLWIGTDRNGQDWLVKLRGGFRAYRERAFGVIAQHLGLSCQSSTFLTLTRDSAPLQQSQMVESTHGAILMASEHEIGCCGETCPIKELNAALEIETDAPVAAFRDSVIPHAIDWVQGEMLGYLCDMHELPGRLFTQTHQFVQIDNELMFTNAPADLLESEWLKTASGRWSPTGIEVARRLCAAVADLPETVLANAAEIPHNFAFEMLWDVPASIRRLPAKATDASTKLSLLRCE